MTNGEAVQTFQKLGLSEYESRALASLFDRHNSTALNISKDASIPYTKIYAVLTDLEKMGLVKCTLERPKKYQPLDPKSVLSSVINSHESRLSDLKALAKEKQEALQEMFRYGGQYERNGKVWYLSSQKAVWEAVNWIISTAEKSIRCISNRNIWEATVADSEMGAVRMRSIENGVIFYNIIQGSFLSHLKESGFKTLAPTWLEFFSNESSHMRVLDDGRLKQNLLIKDLKEVGIPFLTPEDGGIHSGVVFNDKQLVDGVLSYFNMLWEQAQPAEDEIRAAAKAALVSRRKRK